MRLTQEGLADQPGSKAWRNWHILNAEVLLASLIFFMPYSKKTLIDFFFEISHSGNGRNIRLSIVTCQPTRIGKNISSQDSTGSRWYLNQGLSDLNTDTWSLSYPGLPFAQRLLSLIHVHVLRIMNGRLRSDKLIVKP